MASYGNYASLGFSYNSFKQLLFACPGVLVESVMLVSYVPVSQDMMDEICQEQFMEMKFINGGQEHGGRGRGGPPIRGRGGLPPPGVPRYSH